MLGNRARTCGSHLRAMEHGDLLRPGANTAVNGPFRLRFRRTISARLDLSAVSLDAVPSRERSAAEDDRGFYRQRLLELNSCPSGLPKSLSASCCSPNGSALGSI